MRKFNKELLNLILIFYKKYIRELRYGQAFYIYLNRNKDIYPEEHKTIEILDRDYNLFNLNDIDSRKILEPYYEI